jgi:hypothetical protein
MPQSHAPPRGPRSLAPTVPLNFPPLVLVLKQTNSVSTFSSTWNPLHYCFPSRHMSPKWSLFFKFVHWTLHTLYFAIIIIIIIIIIITFILILFVKDCKPCRLALRKIDLLRCHFLTLRFNNSTRHPVFKYPESLFCCWYGNVYTHSQRQAKLQIDTFGWYLFRANWPVVYPEFFSRGGSTISVEDRGQREQGSGGGNSLVRGSAQFANGWNPYSY